MPRDVPSSGCTTAPHFHALNKYVAQIYGSVHVYSEAGI